MPSNDPSVMGVQVQAQQGPMKIVRDVHAGTKRMRDAASEYLPQFPKEKPETYKARLNTSVLYNGVERTSRGLTGMAFRSDPMLGGTTSERTREQWDDLDNEGTTGPGVLEGIFDNGMVDGHCSWLIDMPRVDPDNVPRFAVDEAPIRPFWVTVPKGALRRFETIREDGVTVLSLVAWHETAIEKKPGELYEEEEIDRMREYKLADLQTPQGAELGRGVVFTVWEKKANDTAGKAEWALKETGTLGGRESVPFFTFYTKRVGFLISEPPLLNLAYENIKHWQIRSDNDQLEHVAKVPIFVVTGDAKITELTVSVGQGKHIKGDNADLKVVQADASAVAIGRQSLKDIETHMAALGMAQLEQESRAAETAEARRLERSEKDATLHAAVMGMEHVATTAMRDHADWDGQPSEDLTVTLNHDFEDQLMPAGEIAARVAAWQAKAWTIDTLWDQLQAGEVLPKDFDRVAEKAALENSAADQTEKDMAALSIAMATAGGDGDEPPAST